MTNEILKTLLSILFSFIILYTYELFKKNKECEEEKVIEALESHDVKLSINR